MRISRTAAVLAVATVLGTVTSVGAYVLSGSSWPTGTIKMEMQLGTSGTLSDGSASWNSAAEGPLAMWNTYISRASFRVIRDSTAPIGDLNGYNNVFWADDIYGSAFGSRTLAVTRRWFLAGRITDADVIFNRAFSWNSYRGRVSSNGVVDIRRVALHEFGHVLGLLHPDDYGQFVSAIMNATISDLEQLTSDDIAGAQALYGGSGPTPAPTAPGSPSSLTVGSFGSSVTLNWRAPTAGGTPTAYVVEAGSVVGAANLANFSTGSTSTTYAASNVGSGIYYVRVRAANAAGVSAASNEATLTVGNGCAGPPGPPTTLMGSSSGTTVTLAWSPASGTPTTYIVEAGSAPGLSNLANSDLGSAVPSLVAPNVGRGLYYIRVRGKNACGVGPVSNEVTVIVR
jgi:hypothetical protein